MRRDNERAGREVIPQAAAARLFAVSPTAIRSAVADRRVRVAFRLSESPFGGKPAPLLDLADALRYWQRRAPGDLAERLAAMRREALTFALPTGPEDAPRYIGFNILGVKRVTAPDFEGAAS